MLKYLPLLLSISVLAGCGQVMVFGHVVGEPRTRTDGQEVKPAESAANPTPAPAATRANDAKSAPATVASRGAAQPANPDASADIASAAPSHSTEPGPVLAPALPSSPIVHRVKSVSLTVAPPATAKIAADPRFNADALREAVETELRTRQLLDTQDRTASDRAEILISDFSTRSAVNAVVFGYHLGSGSLAGDIHVGDGPGAGAETFKVIADTRLAIAANGADKNPLGPLYRRFAVLAADRLAGTVSKPEEPDRDLMPR